MIHVDEFFKELFLMSMLLMKRFNSCEDVDRIWIAKELNGT